MRWTVEALWRGIGHRSAPMPAGSEFEARALGVPAPDLLGIEEAEPLVSPFVPMRGKLLSHRRPLAG